MLCISRSQMRCFSNRAGSYDRRGNEANGGASTVTNPIMDRAPGANCGIGSGKRGCRQSACWRTGAALLNSIVDILLGRVMGPILLAQGEITGTLLRIQLRLLDLAPAKRTP
jgi:hypothetical protein